MGVSESSACGSMIHATSTSGTFGSPLTKLRSAKRVSGGASGLVASAMPGIVWQAPQS